MSEGRTKRRKVKGGRKEDEKDGIEGGKAKPEKWKMQMNGGWQGNEGMNVRAGTQRGKRRTGSEDRKVKAGT